MNLVFCFGPKLWFWTWTKLNKKLKMKDPPTLSIGKFWILQKSFSLKLKLNTKITLNHPPPTTINFLKGSRPSKRLRFDI